MINDDDEDFDSDRLNALYADFTDDTDNSSLGGSCNIPVVEPNRAAMSPLRDISQSVDLNLLNLCYADFTDDTDNSSLGGSCNIPVVEPNRAAMSPL